MSTSELTLHFADTTTVNVRFDDIESGPLPFVNPLTVKDRTDLRWYTETYAATSLADPDDREAKRIEARLPELGKALFTAVFNGMVAYQLYIQFRQLATEPRVITINSQDATILALSWELLHDPTGVYLFRERPRISIRRKITGATGGRAPFRLRAKPYLHLLFVVSRPEGTGFLDRADGQAVLDAIDDFAPGRVTCEFLRPATLNALVARLDDRSKPPIDILHFDGHGIFRFVLIHGYNVGFAEAAIRAAQLGYDLKVPGEMAFFSWPSRGQPLLYTADEATIEASVAAIATFLRALVADAGAERVYLFVHSMGNRGLLSALERLVNDGLPDLRLGQVFFCAPDVDVRVFQDKATRFPHRAENRTLLVSPQDRAVALSQWLHQYARVGVAPPITVIPGIDTIEVRGFGLLNLGHGYFAEAAPIIHDLSDAIRTRQKASERQRLQRLGEYYGIDIRAD